MDISSRDQLTPWLGRAVELVFQMPRHFSWNTAKYQEMSNLQGPASLEGPAQFSALRSLWPRRPARR
jgi:hypothetical protein